MELKDTAFIIGDGVIGKRLANHLRNRGLTVVLTSRKRNRVSKECLYLDLASAATDWPEFPRNSLVFLCAGESSIRKCETQPSFTEKLNVDASIKIAEKVVNNSCFLLFISTNMVFDGTIPLRKPDDYASPRNIYGKQKLMAENAILSLQNTAVLRLSKVIHADMPLFKNWISDLKSKKEINPFNDMVFAPVLIDRAVRVISMIATSRVSGITQFSASNDISYEDAALYIAKAINADLDLVKAVASNKDNSSGNFNPEFTTLDSSAVCKLLGINQPDPYEALDGILVNA